MRGAECEGPPNLTVMTNKFWRFLRKKLLHILSLLCGRPCCVSFLMWQAMFYVLCHVWWAMCVSCHLWQATQLMMDVSTLPLALSFPSLASTVTSSSELFDFLRPGHRFLLPQASGGQANQNTFQIPPEFGKPSSKGEIPTPKGQSL